MKPRILIVEDEPNLASGLKLNFEIEGYEVSWCADGKSARKSFHGMSPDLVILDLMLPDTSGLSLLQEFKKADLRKPVLLLTACATDEDRIQGLSLGADDYLTKPFSLEELILRVRGMLQRCRWYEKTGRHADGVPIAGSFGIGSAVVDPERSTLEKDGNRYLLTELELSLLVFLWKHEGRFLSREKILEHVWGYVPGTSTRTLDIFISRLRRMLGDSSSAPAHLITHRGMGYMLKAR